MVAVLFAACDSSYDAPTGEPNHSSVESSLKNSGNTVQVNGSFYLYDFSRGVKSRAWELTADATNLEGEELLSSTDQRLDVIFTVPGEKVVKLHQVFNDSVYVNDGFIDGNEVATEFTITVLDSVRANFVAEHVLDNTELNNANGALNEVQAGREVKYMDLSTGEPTNVKWILTREDGNQVTTEAKNGEAVVKISGVGVYDLAMVSSSDFGRDTLVYTDYLNIVPSTDPMILEYVKAMDGKLYLKYGRDVLNPSTCPVSAFTLQVTNDGQDYPVEVSSIALDSTDPSVIVLTLDELIYNTDEILVSYDDAIGTLISADAMVIDSFDDEMADFVRKDLFVETGYDGTVENSENSNWPYAWWGGEWGEYNQGNNVTTSMAYEGLKSLYFNMNTNGGAILDYRTDAGVKLNTVPVVEGKTYEGSFMVYIDEIGTEDCNFLWMLPNNGWATMMGVYFNGTETTGQWYKVTTRYEASASEDLGFVIRGHNPTATGPLKIYIDNMKFEELEFRP